MPYPPPDPPTEDKIRRLHAAACCCLEIHRKCTRKAKEMQEHTKDVLYKQMRGNTKETQEHIGRIAEPDFTMYVGGVSHSRLQSVRTNIYKDIQRNARKTTPIESLRLVSGNSLFVLFSSRS